MKRGIVGSAILLVVAIGALVVPWYPVVTTQNVTESLPYTFQVPSQDYQYQTVYNLPNRVTLQGFFQSGATLSQVYQDLQSVSLETGSIVSVQVEECSSCSLSLSKDFADKSTVYSVTGSTTSGDFIVPETGAYKIEVINFGTTQGTVSSISISANVPEIGVQTKSDYNAVTVTEYSVATLQPFKVLGVIRSFAIIVAIVIVLVIATLLGLGIITISTRHRR